MDVFTAVSLCTGYDGLGLGLRRVVPNLRTLVYVEREVYPVANLVAKIQEGKLDDAPVWSDVSTFDGRPFAGLVDILHAGIPCQPWSVAGRQKGIEDERWIWQDIFRIIVEIKPRYVFLEEVPGFVRGGGLGYVLSDLAQARYDAQWGCYTAAEVGAPHKRQRLFILAHDERMRPAQPQGSERDQRGRIIDGSEDVAHSQRPEPRLRIRQEPQAEIGRDRPAIGGESMAESSCQGHQGHISEFSAERWQAAWRCAARCGQISGEWIKVLHADECEDLFGDREVLNCPRCGIDYAECPCPGPTEEGLEYREDDYCRRIGEWPAGPGQPQYEWEEPRVVGNHQGDGRPALGTKSAGKQGRTGAGKPVQGQAEPRLGRTTDGASSRVDRLRLLGNGVVPQQAEKAFRELIRE